MSPASDIRQLVAYVVAAYIGANHVADETIPELIRSVHATFASLGVKPAAEELRPAVPIRKSVFLNYIVCLEDGIKLKTMRRHLWSEHKMTPETYRERWKLPDDYPMVAPHYSAQRSDLAKQIGLGRSTPAQKSAPVQRIAKGVRGKRLAPADTV